MTEQRDPYAPGTSTGPDQSQGGYTQAPPAPPYGYPGYGPPKNGLGTAALVLGIIGIVLFWTVFLGFILGILALIFGIIGRKRANRREATNGGAALAGAIMGGIALVASIAIIAAGAAFFEHNKKAFNDYQDCVNAAQTQQDMQNCANEFDRSVR